jgi:hypothetical protein
MEVAIEVKHGGKGWTAHQLEEALRTQLAEDYLKPSTRRHGVLVVTHHRDRRWLDPSTRKPLSFDAVIGWLSGIAAALVENHGGAIEVRCVGINAWREPAPAKKIRKPSKSKTAPKRKPKRRANGRQRPTTSPVRRAPRPKAPRRSA